jgi:hypothetical protein
MAQWVLDAINGAACVDQAHLVGLPEDCGLSAPKLTSILPDQGGMLANAKRGLIEVRAARRKAGQVLLIACDIPTIRPEMVDWRAEAAAEGGADLDYAVVQRGVMERRFPESKRSYVAFRDAEVCGADVNIVHLGTVVEEDLWDRLIAARKSPLRQAALFGFDTLLLILLRRLTVEQAAQLAARRLGLRGRVSFCPFAEIAMDVDKPHQLQIVRADLLRSRAAVGR